MSLQDSLLLDPVPGEIWIAYRTDGIRATGTLSDPLDGSTRYATPVTVTSVTNGGGDPLYQEFWQVGQMLVENNVMELYPLISSNAPVALGFGGLDHVAPYVFKNLSLRGNIARTIEGGSVPGYGGYASRLNSCEKGLVDANVIDLIGTPQLLQSFSGVLQYFDNQAPSGQLIQATDKTSNRQVDELTTRIQEAALIS